MKKLPIKDGKFDTNEALRQLSRMAGGIPEHVKDVLVQKGHMPKEQVDQADEYGKKFK